MPDLLKSPLARDFGNWVAMFRQWRIGCAVAILGFAATCAVLFSLAPLYKAEVQLMLPLNSLVDPASRKGDANLQADPFVVRSYEDLIKNDGISQRVINDLHLGRTQDFADKPTWLSQTIGTVEKLLGRAPDDGKRMFTEKELREDSLLHQYEGRLKAVSDGRSLIVTLSFLAHDPRLAEKVVNTHARYFVDGEIGHYRTLAELKTSWMKDELNRTQSDLLKSQTALQVSPGGTSVLQDHTGNSISMLKMRESLASATVDVYASVLKRYQELLADESYKGTDIRILAPATLPTSPYFPKKLLFAALAALIWIILGFGAAALAALFRVRVSMESWIGEMGLPVLGRVHFPTWRRCFFWQHTIAQQRRDLFWEQVREVQTTIKISGRRHPSLLVTSARPFEGKSLLASALANALAASGVRTLVIGINSRNKHYAKALGDRLPLLDLHDVFDTTTSARQLAVQVDPDSPLYFLGDTGQRELGMPRLPESKLRARLRALKKEFDVVIIDGSAMETLSDTLTLAGVVDEVIVASGADQSVPHQLSEAVAKLRTRSARILGIVIMDRKAPDREKYLRISQYGLYSSLPTVWPIARKSRRTLATLLEKLFGDATTGEERLDQNANPSLIGGTDGG